ncbi:flagellar filament capping protein FliD [Pilosibacter fragilis]|uniref:flagellar filament capping protein FliD n=1 Tax=Pilosibacter fragilis TaxID=3078042 RepID=UPI0031BA6F4F
MSSVSRTSSSLGNTALRGFGGLASGIDRDALIEQMTARTTSKITSKKQAMTKLEWKRDAYRSISNKIIDLQDNYLSYSATKSLKNSDFFAKNQVSVQGNPDYTKYISATGNADTASRVSVLGVNKLATSATLISGEKKTDSAITLGGISASDFSNKEIKTSNLSGTKLTFGTYSITDKQFTTEATFTFPTSYEKKLDDGKTETVTIDYTASSDKIVEQLNEALDSQGFLGKDGKSGIKFTLNGDQIQISQTDSITDKGKSCVIRETSSALKSLGFNSGDMNQDGITLDEFNHNTSSFEAAAITKQPLSAYLKGKSISVSYGGQTKNIELIGDKEEIKDFEAFKDSLQKKLDKAFGSEKVTVGTVTVGEGKDSKEILTFTAKDNKQTLQISADSKELQNALGITSTQSNKISTGSSLWENRDKLGLGKYNTKEELNDALKNFTVNGAKIDNITADTTVDGLLTAINNNKDAGVTAIYLGSENKFVLSSNEKGEGRKITLGADPNDTADAANLIFGGVSTDGTDGEMSILYNGVQTTITSSSNTFSIDGLDIRATNTFNTGSATAEGGVSFTASADTEKVTETVKKFIEAYNAMIDEVRTQATTKPDSNYKPLTDDQKNEMNETSIKNWEDKAKEGILYNSSALKDLDNATQGIFSSMMINGVSYDDLEKIGISFSDDYTAGGKIVFDEEKFKTAMDSDPEKVSDLFTGTHGIVNTIDSTLSTYATRYASKNGNSYGVLIEEAGSEKLSLTLTNNSIYKELKDMQETITNLQSQLSTEQDRYISQFTQMERLINQMNSQSSYLSQLGG